MEKPSAQFIFNNWNQTAACGCGDRSSSSRRAKRRSRISHDGHASRQAASSNRPTVPPPRRSGKRREMALWRFAARHHNMSYQRNILSENNMVAPGSKGLAQGEIRLAALALIAETPRHGYEIIKLIEEKTADWYSPTPSLVYPTLANLAE